MSKVGIHVNNKLFTIACDDGQETRVKQLGQYIDERFRELGQAGAAPNESYMLVLTSLVIADEMFDAREAAEAATANAGNVPALEAQLNNQRAEFETQMNNLRAEYAAHIQNLEAQLSASRVQVTQAEMAAKSKLSQMEAELKSARSQVSAAPVVDMDAAKAQWLEESRAKEQDIAKVVDALASQLEVVVKGLKRAS